MDIMQVGDLRLNGIPIQALRSKVREKLSCMLNQRKLIVSPEGLYRDYRGLAELMELPVDNIWTPSYNPVASLLERSCHSLGDLQGFLKRIDRFDVLDDSRAQFHEDAVVWYERKNQVVPSLVPCDERNSLTIDDILESTVIYDAFLLYVDADIEFAARILKTLESQYNLRICVKDRLLGGAIFEHSAIMKLILDRCRRLIVVLSDEFVSSDKDTFFLNFAQFLSFEKETKKRFIVPVKYKQCTLPEHYLIYFILDYMRQGRIINFWEKLHASVIPMREGNHGARLTESPQTNKSKCIEAVEDAAPAVDSLPPLKSSSDSNQSISSTTKFVSSDQIVTTKTIPKVTRHKTMKSKLSKFFKRISTYKSKKLPQAEPVACAS